MNEAEYLKLVEAAQPLLDQVHLNICFCDRHGRIVYVNIHAAASIKALAELVGFDEIKTGYDVVGTQMAKWHRRMDFTKAMDEHRAEWGMWHIKGARWRARSGRLLDDQENVIGYVGAWEELDQGPSPADKTEATYERAPYRQG